MVVPNVEAGHCGKALMEGATFASKSIVGRCQRSAAKVAFDISCVVVRAHTRNTP